MKLDQQYHRHGISFRYPSDWELVEDADPEMIQVSLLGDGTLWSVSILPRRPHPGDVMSQAVEAMREEYGEIDFYPGEATPEECTAGIEFFAMELVNWTTLKAYSVGGRTLLVQAQGTDHERETQEPTLQEVTASLTTDPDESIIIQ